MKEARHEMGARTFFTVMPRWVWITLATVLVVAAGAAIWIFGFRPRRRLTS